MFKERHHKIILFLIILLLFPCTKKETESNFLGIIFLTLLGSDYHNFMFYLSLTPFSLF